MANSNGTETETEFLAKIHPFPVHFLDALGYKNKDNINYSGKATKIGRKLATNTYTRRKDNNIPYRSGPKLRVNRSII